LQTEGVAAMLVLSRKKNESIVIDDNITIVVVEIRGDKVRLGVEAPKEVPVHRREVFDAIHRSETRNLSPLSNLAPPLSAEKKQQDAERAKLSRQDDGNFIETD